MCGLFCSDGSEYKNRKTRINRKVCFKKIHLRCDINLIDSFAHTYCNSVFADRAMIS